MLDASNPDPAPKAKKIKSQHRPTQRFWPNSIAAGVLQQQGGTPGTNPDGKIIGWDWWGSWKAKIQGMDVSSTNQGPCHFSFT